MKYRSTYVLFYIISVTIFMPCDNILANLIFTAPSRSSSSQHILVTLPIIVAVALLLILVFTTTDTATHDPSSGVLRHSDQIFLEPRKYVRQQGRFAQTQNGGHLQPAGLISPLRQQYLLWDLHKPAGLHDMAVQHGDRYFIYVCGPDHDPDPSNRLVFIY